MTDYSFRRKRGEEVALNFEDAVLYDMELALFRKGEWLNDACIHFGFKWIARDLGEEAILMDPAVYSFLILQCEDEDDFEGLRRQLKFDERKVILCPINDAANFEAVNRGTHWSLLAYWPANDRFEHFDSMPSGTMHHWIAAPIAADRLKRTQVGAFVDIAKYVPLPKGDIPPQTNGYDCGAHMLAVADCLARNASRGEDDRKRLLKDVTPDYVARFRADLGSKARELSRAFLEAKNLAKAAELGGGGGGGGTTTAGGEATTALTTTPTGVPPTPPAPEDLDAAATPRAPPEATTTEETDDGGHPEEKKSGPEEPPPDDDDDGDGDGDVVPAPPQPPGDDD